MKIAHMNLRILHYYNCLELLNELSTHFSATDYCALPLGMESGWIDADSINASSSLDTDHGAHHARLHGPSSWIPDVNDGNPKLQVHVTL